MSIGDAGWSSPVARQAHNLKVVGSNPAPATIQKDKSMTDNNNARDRLVSFISRIERLEDEKNQAQTAIKEIYEEAKGEGYDVPTMKKVVRLRKKKREELAEEDALLQHYREVLGI